MEVKDGKSRKVSNDIFKNRFVLCENNLESGKRPLVGVCLNANQAQAVLIVTMKGLGGRRGAEKRGRVATHDGPRLLSIRDVIHDFAKGIGGGKR